MKIIRVQGLELSEAALEQIRCLRAEHPDWSRYRLSVALAQQWQWRNQAGRLKDMAARTLLLKLQRRGLIDLPAARKRNGHRQRCARAPNPAPAELLPSQPDPIVGPLATLQPVRLELVASLAQRRWVCQLLERHHYRGFAGAVGENVQYVAREAQGRDLALMVFGAPAWKVAARDRFIGWSVSQRRQALGHIANQQRFLILPWVQVAHLASHLLALAVRRLAQDWQNRYGHPVWLVESFIEEPRFAGSAYQAAGWICVGHTTGRTRQDRQRTLQSPIKAVWVRPLHPQFRKHLLCL